MPEAYTFLDGAIRLIQPDSGHRSGTDAALLIAASRADAARCCADGGLIIDFGAGVGTIGLALAVLTPGAQVRLVERDADLAALSQANAVLNGVSDRAVALTGDVTNRTALADLGLGAEQAGLVVMNPPFHPPGSRASPDPSRADAYIMPKTDLRRWIASAAHLLRTGGVLVMIHRPENICAILSALEPQFGAIGLRPVETRYQAPATRLLVRAVKGRRTAPTLHSRFALQGHDGRFTAEAEALHRGNITLDWTT